MRVAQDNLLLCVLCDDIPSSSVKPLFCTYKWEADNELIVTPKDPNIAASIEFIDGTCYDRLCRYDYNPMSGTWSAHNASTSVHAKVN